MAVLLTSVSVRPSVRLSVRRPSHAGIVSRRMKLRSCGFHHQVGQSSCFWRGKDRLEIRRGSPLASQLKCGGRLSEAKIWPIMSHNLETCKTGYTLLLITNVKSHMGFRRVPKSVTLNDLERRNGRYFAFFPPNSVPVGADYIKVVEDTPILSTTEM